MPEPDPLLLAFFFFKKFVYLELLAVLALLRVAAGYGLSRWMAGAALLIALPAIAVTFAPMAGLTGPTYASGARMMAAGSGLPILVLPSVLMCLSALLPLPRWRWIDLVHTVLFVALLALTWWFS
ncbi:hypothetical protein J1C49_12635 [Cognatishimia sp. F0-27]|nr:hypothetical protein [Cognatishimia sp. F0-27]